MNKKNITIIIWISFILLNAILLKNIIIKKSTLNNYFRLHVVANSNSIKDQTIKMNVAKSVNSKIDEIIIASKNNSKSEVKKTIQDNAKEILTAANSSLKDQNAEETAIMKIGNIYYDEKKKENISMNEGIYDSVKIIIGDGKGKNFWSLIYPYSYAGMYELSSDFESNINYPLTDNENNTILETNYIISDKNVEYKSGIIEFAKKMWFN